MFAAGVLMGLAVLLFMVASRYFRIGGIGGSVVG